MEDKHNKGSYPFTSNLQSHTDTYIYREFGSAAIKLSTKCAFISQMRSLCAMKNMQRQFLIYKKIFSHKE